jgi:hypothetical protein
MVENILMKKIILLLLLPLLFIGCQTESIRKKPVDLPVSPKMSSAYVGGVMTISWKSEPGRVYTIYYTDAPRGARPDWKPLPHAKKLPGNGRTLTVTDESAPNIQRRYLLMTGDQRPYRH